MALIEATLLCLWHYSRPMALLRASSVVMDPHMHMHFFIRNAYANLGMWLSGPCLG